MTMTGSAKQIAWAESIINDARETIRRNIELDEQRAATFGAYFDTELAAWNKVSELFERAISMATSASQIIDSRSRLSGSAMIRMQNQFATMLRNGRTLDDIH